MDNLLLSKFWMAKGEIFLSEGEKVRIPNF